MRRRPVLAAALLVAAASFALAKDEQAMGLAGQLRTQAEALHAAAQRPEEGPKPPRMRNWMLRKEIQNLAGLAEQMEILAGREKHKRLWMRTHMANIGLTAKRIRFGIFTGGARHLDGVPPAFDTCVETVKQLHAHLWAAPGQAPVEAAPPTEEPPAEDAPPEGDEPPAEDAPPEGDAPPAEDEPPVDDAPPAEGDEPPSEDEPPVDDAPPAEGDEPPAEDAPPVDDAPPAEGDAPPSDDAPPEKSEPAPAAS